jgi:hypothetical protein
MFKKIAQILLVLFAGCLVTFYFFSNVLNDINHKYFAQGGDGIKDYYVMLYHLKYDSSYLHSQAMNYPYGENIFFSGAQPFLTNLIKFISSHIYDIRPYTLAIHNLSIIFSLIITVLIIFLIFRHLRLPYWYSLLIALGITFLSPQIDRMGGHFSLSYTFFIPAILYLIFKFYQYQKLWISLIIMILFIIVSFTHGYFFIFYAIILAGYWIYHFYEKKSSDKQDYWNILVQFIIPLFTFLLITNMYDTAPDRPQWPWGFLVYRAYPESIFLSMGRPYWQWLNLIVKVRNVEWEGVAYVGLISTLVFMILTFKGFKNLFRKTGTKIFTVTDNNLLNVFFWISLLTLLFSFGLPFIAGLEFLLQYLGPIRQFRGIGRFAWLFFYIFNIVTFYLIWQYFRQKQWSKYLLLIPVAILYYDAWFNSRSIQYFINNQLPEFDYAFHHDYNGKINVREFQAIMPIPYFNVGSENYWYSDKCPAMYKAYTLAVFTGLPLNAVNMSRTSISQCVANLQLVMDPYKDYPVLKAYDSSKYVLVLADTTCDKLSLNEKRIIQYSTLIDTLWGNQIRKISIKDFYRMIEDEKNRTYNLTKLNSNAPYRMITYDSLSSYITYSGSGSLRISNRKAYNLYYDRLFGKNDSVYTVSFWVYNMDRDMVPRNVIEVAVGAEKDNWYNVSYYSFKDIVTTFDQHWGLIQFDIPVKNANDFVSIAILKPPLGSPDIIMDNFLIRSNDVYFWLNNQLFVNNKMYKMN